MTWRSLNTHERIEAIRDVWQPGMSAQAICDAIPGCPSRNAIIGVFNRHSAKMDGMRLGIVGDNGRVVPIKRSTVRKPKVAHAPSIIAEPQPDTAFHEPHVAGIPLMMLDGCRCKWPINDGGPFLFCGEEAKENRPYCAFHSAASVGSGTQTERSAHRWLQAAE